MDTGISALRESEVGEVFTPIEWAGWLLNRGNVFDWWINGATVCDPTAGEGAFALALFDEAQGRGIPLTAALLSRLCLIERRSGYLEKFRRVAKQRYNVEIPDTSIHRTDVVLDPPQRSFDILVGNPPWGNFSNLPPDYKEMLKPCFIEAGLVPNRKAVLLGSTRTDIAALVLKMVIGRLLRDRGTAHFFVPLSPFTGDDAQGRVSRLRSLRDGLFGHGGVRIQQDEGLRKSQNRLLRRLFSKRERAGLSGSIFPRRQPRLAKERSDSTQNVLGSMESNQRNHKKRGILDRHPPGGRSTTPAGSEHLWRERRLHFLRLSIFHRSEISFSAGDEGNVGRSQSDAAEMDFSSVRGHIRTSAGASRRPSVTGVRISGKPREETSRENKVPC